MDVDETGAGGRAAQSKERANPEAARSDIFSLAAASQPRLIPEGWSFRRVEDAEWGGSPPLFRHLGGASFRSPPAFEETQPANHRPAVRFSALHNFALHGGLLNPGTAAGRGHAASIDSL